MLIQLKDIKKNAHYVRKQTDREKLDELADSIQEIGMLMPVKVRTNGTGYEVVFGQRRVDAARQAGLEEIEAIVVMVSDEDALIQGLAENVIREDMAAIDIAKALAAIKEKTGWTNEVIGSKFGWGKQTVGQYLSMLEYSMVDHTLGYEHVNEAKAGTGGDKALVEKVLQKAADEGLSTRQTRQLAETVKQAQEYRGDAGVGAILAMDYEDIKHVQGPAEIIKTIRPPAEKKPERIFTQEEIEQNFRWMEQPIYEEIEELSKALSAKIQFMLQQIFETRIKTQEGAALLATIATQLERLAQTTLRTTSEIEDVGPIMEQAIKIKDVSERWHFLDDEIDKLYSRGVK